MASEIKVFYSWQSDLPNNTTRGFLQECIDAAIKNLKDTVEVEADRDTKGTWGSPDIVHTIFSKIDECDLFIADVSIVNKYTAVDDNGEKAEAIKLSPNPNVLLRTRVCQVFRLQQIHLSGIWQIPTTKRNG